MNITTEQMRFWSPEVRELDPYVPGEQPKIQNILKFFLTYQTTVIKVIALALLPPAIRNSENVHLY